MLIPNLPTGTLAALRGRAEEHGRSMEAEVREILVDALGLVPSTIVDLVSMGEGPEIEFEPGRLGLIARTAEL